VEAHSTYVALLHHPMRDRLGEVVTTALTTLDLHDMARTCRTYDVPRFYVVHPIEAQRAIAERILAHWRGDEARHDFRGDALRRVRVVATLEDAEADLAAHAGQRARRIATTAKRTSGALSIANARAVPGPCLLAFGTGFGMSEALLGSMDHVLAPIEASKSNDYNHLSVRSACAILLDRLYGDRKDCRPFPGTQEESRES
jgi:hypothetical protein